jgi:acyl dehydratase
MELHPESAVNRANRLVFTRAPSALRYMLRAALAWRVRQVPDAGLPPLAAEWRGCQPDDATLALFERLTGLDSAVHVHPLLLHARGFRLHMTLLTHPEFPLPVWRMFQIHNTLVNHAPVPRGRPLTQEVRILGARPVARGIEVDAASVHRMDGETVFETRTVFYLRGRFGCARGAQTDRVPPALPARIVGDWSVERGDPFAFGRLTGDYNGIHVWDTYARVLGFPRALAHPQRSLARIALHSGSWHALQHFRAEVWLRGPVSYGRVHDLHLSDTSTSAYDFGITARGERRPSILGRYVELPGAAPHPWAGKPSAH